MAVLLTSIAYSAGNQVFPQQAHAVVTTDFNPTVINTCNESGAGTNTPVCTIATPVLQTIPVQNPGDSSNIYNRVINVIAENDCDESGNGDNTPDCTITASYTLGPSTQTNTPVNSPADQQNTVDILTDDDIENDCNESGNGNNDPTCTAVATLEIEQIDQTNDATGTVVTNDVEQDNNVEIFSAWNLDNRCDETDDGNNVAECTNTAEFLVGPVEQTNTATGTETASFDQDNEFEPVSVGTLENDCDESGTGDNTAFCENIGLNEVQSVTQGSGADGSGDATFEQVNEADTVQEYNLENDCNETDVGLNDAECSIDSVNSIEDISQSNGGLASESANVDQENVLDSESSSTIPGVRQVITGDNTCDETGTGDNTAIVQSDGSNDISDLTQSNSIDEASGTSDVFQDNEGLISQVLDEDNDCDESSTGNNDAECINLIPSNDIDNVEQANIIGTAADDALISQDNGVDLSQTQRANNDCNELDTGDNTAFCENNVDVLTVQEIDDILQRNVVDSGTGDSDIDQNNDATVDQEFNSVNTCDESQGGLNDASCTNTSPENHVDGIEQINTGSAEDAASLGQDNTLAIFQDLRAENGCDETGTGDNLAICDNISGGANTGNFIDEVSQTNTADGLTGDQDINQINDALVSQDLNANNDCDESGTGNNLALCTTDVFNTVGAITQTNTADDTTADGTYRNAVDIHQDLRAVNDCDDSGSGDNLAVCDITVSNDIGDITQTNTGAVAGSQNRLTIDQNIDVENDCDNTRSTSNTQTCSFTGSLIVEPITQTDGQSLTIRQNVDERQTCSEGGTCTIDITETFVAPLAAAQRTPTTATATPIAATTTSSDDRGATTSAAVAVEDEDTEEEQEGQVAALSLASSTTPSQEQDTNNENDDNGDSSSGQTAAVAAATSEEDDDDDGDDNTDESNSGTTRASSSSSGGNDEEDDDDDDRETASNDDDDDGDDGSDDSSNNRSSSDSGSSSSNNNNSGTTTSSNSGGNDEDDDDSGSSSSDSSSSNDNSSDDDGEETKE